MLGAIAYTTLEMVWRAYTHWTMTVTGGICFVLVYMISKQALPLWVKGTLGALVITAIEFAVGVTVNLIFGLQVWDYSDIPFNLLGQICPRYSAYWFILCIGVMPLCKRLSERCLFMFGEDVHDKEGLSFPKGRKEKA